MAHIEAARSIVSNFSAGQAMLTLDYRKRLVASASVKLRRIAENASADSDVDAEVIMDAWRKMGRVSHAVRFAPGEVATRLADVAGVLGL